MLFDFVVGSVVQAMMMGLLAFRTKFIGKENRKLKRETKGKKCMWFGSVRKRLVQRKESNTFHRFQLQFFTILPFQFPLSVMPSFSSWSLTLAQKPQIHDPFVSLLLPNNFKNNYH